MLIVKPLETEIKILELKWGQNQTNKECFKKECENIKYVENKLVIRMIVFVLKFSDIP